MNTKKETATQPPCLLRNNGSWRLDLTGKTALLFIVMVLCHAHPTQAQEEERKESRAGTHQLALGISHTHLAEGIGEDGSKKWMILPSWALDYTYWIGNKWGIGLHNDLVVENFKVESTSKDGEELERTKPFCSIAAALFKPGEHHTIVAGVGGEFAKEENFFVTRIGYEYGWELPRKWELSVSLNWDLKWQGYNSWSIGLALAKLWPKKERHQ